MKQKSLTFSFWQVARLEIGMVLFSINWTKSFQMLLQILKKHYPLAFVQSFEGTCKTKSCICNYISGTNFMWMYFSGIDAKLIYPFTSCILLNIYVLFALSITIMQFEIIKEFGLQQTLWIINFWNPNVKSL